MAAAFIALTASLAAGAGFARSTEVLQTQPTTATANHMPNLVQSLRARWRSLTGGDASGPSLDAPPAGAAGPTAPVTRVAGPASSVAPSGQAVTAPQTMSALWQQYETWLSAHLPEGLQGLSPGASAPQLLSLQAALDTPLPSAFQDWARTHDGQADDAVGLLDGNLLLPIAEIRSQWAAMNALLKQGHFQQPGESEPPGAIEPVWWSPRWIPIASDGSGNLVCIDMAPGPDGTVGQIIDFDHETVHRTVLAPSFEAYVRKVVGEVLAGRYGYSEDHGRLMPLSEF
jgi:cell wall assembly regulator SMI1